MKKITKRRRNVTTEITGRNSQIDSAEGEEGRRVGRGAGVGLTKGS